MLEGVMDGIPDVHLYTDASGSIGCGAWWVSSWCQLRWPAIAEPWGIAIKELLPIVISCILWGNQWRQKRILVHCDNQAVVEIINAGRSKDPQLMQLLRCLFFILAHFELSLRAEHIPGVLNGAADAISRDNIHNFHSQVPEACMTPSVIPGAVLDLLFHQQPDWTSPAWSQLFTSCLQQD